MCDFFTRGDSPARLPRKEKTQFLSSCRVVTCSIDDRVSVIPAKHRLLFLAYGCTASVYRTKSFSSVCMIGGRRPSS
jgi:hypothetical protein